MKSATLFALILFMVASLQESQARLMGKRWSRESIGQTSNHVEASPSASQDGDQAKVEEATFTGTVLSTIFDLENDNDACYDCCCDRDVVCNTNGKSEETCQNNACNDGATCASKGYACPSYDCDAAKEMW
jgi:hypothetical protein